MIRPGKYTVDIGGPGGAIEVRVEAVYAIMVDMTEVHLLSGRLEIGDLPVSLYVRDIQAVEDGYRATAMPSPDMAAFSSAPMLRVEPATKRARPTRMPRKVTLRQLREAGACFDGYNKLVRALGGPDDRKHLRGRVDEGFSAFNHEGPVAVGFIATSVGLPEAIWACAVCPGSTRDLVAFALWLAGQYSSVLMCDDTTRMIEKRLTDTRFQPQDQPIPRLTGPETTAITNETILQQSRAREDDRTLQAVTGMLGAIDSLLRRQGGPSLMACRIETIMAGLDQLRKLGLVDVTNAQVRRAFVHHCCWQ